MGKGERWSRRGLSRDVTGGGVGVRWAGRRPSHRGRRRSLGDPPEFGRGGAGGGHGRRGRPNVGCVRRGVCAAAACASSASEPGRRADGPTGRRESSGPPPSLLPVGESASVPPAPGGALPQGVGPCGACLGRVGTRACPYRTPPPTSPSSVLHWRRRAGPPEPGGGGGEELAMVGTPRRPGGH